MTEGCALILHGVFVENLDWLQEHLEQLTDDDFLLLNCHGQLEIYTHVQVQKSIFDAITGWGFQGNVVSVFCIDAAFCIDASKFLAGCLLSLSAMSSLKSPHVYILTKCDLLSGTEVDGI